MRKIFLFFLSLIFSAKEAYAHCPLCTAGAVIAAGGAAYLGVKTIVIGLFIGAFGVSMGSWVSKMIKKQYVPYQNFIIIIFSFGTTIIPIAPYFEGFYPFYISLIGEYGSLLNRTYLINSFITGSLIGGALVLITPLLSGKITKFREGRIVPFQGVAITLIVLLIGGGILQLII